MRNLPLELMNTALSNPRPDLLERLKKLQITDYLNKYEAREDNADAYDGAFTATHIELELASGVPRKTEYIEVLGWYDFYHKNLQSPFYDGLKTTLSAMGLEEFYEEAINYIIDQNGKL